MAPGAGRAPIDYVSVADFLSALAYPARLELLDMLRFPHTVGEIRLTPHRTAPGENPDRPVARPTIQAHLDKLVEADLVREEQVEQSGRKVNRYTVNPQKLYALTEDMRRLSVRYAGKGAASDVTGTVEQPVEAETARGPRLVLVHGVYEGKAYMLDAASAQDGKWTIGRKRGLPIALDYDVFVSTENATVEREADGFAIVDLPESKNGTSVNWVPLRKGQPRRLRPGDVIGVGRSLLVFAAD